MTDIRLHALLFAVLVLVAAPRQVPELQTDAEFQATLHRFADATDRTERTEALEALRANAGERHARLVEQLLLFSEQSTSTREGVVFGVVVERLAIPTSHVVDALVPLLETDDLARRESVGRVLAGTEAHSHDRTANFDAYEDALRRGDPEGLLRHMYATDPDAALALLIRTRVAQPVTLRALRLAQHELADLRWKLRYRYLDPRELPAAASPAHLDALSSLASSEFWWARATAAATLAEYPGLRDAAPDLTEDPHPLVRELASR